MFLKALKEKSNKNYLNKLVSERQVNHLDTNIDTLGVLLNLDEIDNFDNFRILADHINIRPNKLKIIAFTKTENTKINFWDICFTPKDFGWNGTIKNIELQSFIDTPFDALISYYENPILELKLITAYSKAKFKIGILQTDLRLNDLILKTPLNEFELFKKELIKYLRVLKKIN